MRALLLVLALLTPAAPAAADVHDDHLPLILDLLNPRPQRPAPGVVWEPPRGGSICRDQVAQAIRARYGISPRTLRFEGDPEDGLASSPTRHWRFQCDQGRVHIWRERR